VWRFAATAFIASNSYAVCGIAVHVVGNSDTDNTNSWRVGVVTNYYEGGSDYAQTNAVYSDWSTVQSVPGTATWVTNSITDSVNIISGGKYWVVIQSTDFVSGGNYISWERQTPYLSGDIANYINALGSWVSPGTLTTKFKILSQ
jgi:hypothetical protein